MKPEDFKRHSDYVIAVTNALPKWAIEVLYNGFGSEKWGDAEDLFIPRKWQQRFEESGGIRFHDIGYWLGGSNNHRRNVDYLCYRYCARAAGWSLMGQRYALETIIALRVLGWTAFEKREKPRTFAELIDVAESRR
jgi:hypothetical protein